MAMYLLNRLTYPQRLFVWLLAYSVLLVGSFVVFQYHREKVFKGDEINTKLQLINTYILTELEEGYEPAAISLKEFYPLDNIRMSIISDSGHIVYDNALETLPGTNHLGREEIKQALKSGTGYSMRRQSESDGNYYFYSAKRGDNGFIVRTAIPYSVSLSTLLQADYGFLWVMGIITIVMCVLGYFATRRVGLHIQRLNKFAENVESGGKISDVEPFPHDELGEISNHIVRLYAKLQKANHDRELEHRAAMHEQMEKERIKKQLTNNINHELKTPVASIRICVETLLSHKNMSEEQTNLFLRRSLLNTERLERLLADVALITRMDDGKDSIIKESVNLDDIIDSVVIDRQPAAESKGMVIENGIDREIKIYGNPSLLESVFYNLIDNAIAYSGGSKIRLVIEYCLNDKIVLSVSDNGCGIPPEHLERVFERFYRIDKGRSRAAGGTGLGLSIVKNAVKIHGGNIVAENLRTGGLSFRITLPKHTVGTGRDE